MNKYISDIRSRNEKQEKKYEALYTECEKRDCDRGFAKAFKSRAEMFPTEQTLTFMENSRVGDKYLKRWKILLEVLTEKGPSHKKCDEWKHCIGILSDER